MSIHKDVEATLSVKENWGMGSMGGHPMMNNGGEQVGGNMRMRLFGRAKTCKLAGAAW